MSMVDEASQSLRGSRQPQQLSPQSQHQKVLNDFFKCIVGPKSEENSFSIAVFHVMANSLGNN